MSDERQEYTNEIDPTDSQPSEESADEDKVRRLYCKVGLRVGISLSVLFLLIVCVYIFLPWCVLTAPNIRWDFMPPTTATKSSRCGKTSLLLSATPDRLEGGQTVEIEFSVENIDDERDQKYSSEEEPVMDIAIPTGYDDEHDTNTYTYWSDGRVITPGMRFMELAPGESKSITMTWTAPEGAYGDSALLRGIVRYRETTWCSVDLPYWVGSHGPPI